MFCIRSKKLLHRFTNVHFMVHSNEFKEKLCINKTFVMEEENYQSYCKISGFEIKLYDKSFMYEEQNYSVLVNL